MSTDPHPEAIESARPSYATLPSERIQRFWSLVDKSADCWLWLGTLNRGYGVFSIGRPFPGQVTRGARAHRVAWELLRQRIPDGLTIDHLCRNTRCVNADHLEVVTVGENTLRGETITGLKARQRFCSRGHAILITGHHGRAHWRCCLVCKRLRNRASAHRMSSAAKALGLCGGCHKRKPVGDAKYCETCRAYKRALRARRQQ